MLRLDSPFFRIITNFGNIIIISILWVIGCLPVITITASTSALYHTCVKVILHGRGYVIKEFIHSYSGNLKQGCLITFLSLIIVYILYMNYTYISHFEQVPFYLVLMYRCSLLFFCGILLYIIPNLSRFRVSFLMLLKLSLFMMIRHFYLTFIMMILLIAVVILILSIPVTLLFLPGLYMILKSLVMETILKKYMPRSEDGSDENAWYFE